MFIFCGGCQFSVHSLDISGLGEMDMGVGADLATADLSGGVVDLAGADLTPGPDIADPCGTPPALGSGYVAAQCVIGNPPTIDGNLADWPIGSFTAMNHQTAAQATGGWDPNESVNDADSSARFFVRWDASFLYVAVAITDDVRQTPNGLLTDNDALEIFLDGDHNRAAMYDAATDWQLVFSADNKTAAYQNGMSKTFPSGIVVALGGTSPSWNLEAKIPWAAVGGAGTIGRVLGFDLKLDDNDGGNGTRDRALILFYAAPPGGPCMAPYCRTDAFGAVQLQGR